MKIQSCSDIITNSSTEVFIINSEYADIAKDKAGIDSDILNVDFLKNNLYLHHEIYSICKMAGIDMTVNDFVTADENDIDSEQIHNAEIAFLDYNADKINEFLKGYSLIQIDEKDPVDINMLRAIRKFAIWSDFK